jgi:hypothetical protein
MYRLDWTITLNRVILIATDPSNQCWRQVVGRFLLGAVGVGDFDEDPSSVLACGREAGIDSSRENVASSRASSSEGALFPFGLGSHLWKKNAGEERRFAATQTNDK